MTVKESKTTQKDHYVVAIGASAGGLEAIHEFFDNMPQNSFLSFVVIQHLSPDYKSLLVELVSKHTHMKVFEAQHNLSVQKECVYIIPNNKMMTIEKGKLKLQDKQNAKSPNTAIDIFLQSLAEDRKDKAVAVILSGTGTDGTRGIEAVHHAGGLVIVQDPVTARFDGMPNSAIKTGMADYILSPEMMPDELYAHLNETPVHTLQKGKLDKHLLNELFGICMDGSGHDFQNYKTPTLIRRIARRMSDGNFGQLAAYVEHLQGNPAEVKQLCRDFLINVTRFFRDPLAFEALETLVFPQLVRGKTADDVLKIWVSACSTGEEAYSIAILMDRYLRKQGKNLQIKYFATDIDQNNIDFASANRYAADAVRDIPKGILETYFTRKGDSYSVIPRIRKSIVFARHNLISDPPFIKSDMISCRNMLIYLDSSLQRKILADFHFSLNQGGVLFLGSSETAAPIREGMDELDAKWKIYSKSGNIRFRGSEFVRNPVKSKGSKENRHAPGDTREYKKNTAQLIFEKLGYVILYIDENHNVQDSEGDFKQYLSLPEKRLSLNLLKMVPPDVSVMLSIAIRQANKENRQVRLDHVRLDVNNEERFCDIVVFPAEKSTGYAGILFSRTTTPAPADRPGPLQGAGLTGQAEYISELEAELNDTRNRLQIAIENMETSNEELQSSNEELMSANEELQSGNEELQSLNEELHTLNTEHQLKIRELIDLNDDMDNYFRSSDIGQIFLDDELLIRKFNHAAIKLVNLIESDIGRPITHMSNNLVYPDFLKDIRRVENSGQPIEKQVELVNGTMILMRILPYIRQDKHRDGLIITFVDVTEFSRLNNIVSGVFDASLSAVIVLRAELNRDGDIEGYTCIKANNEASGILNDRAPEGKSLGELAPELLTRRLFERLNETFRNGQPMRSEQQLINSKRNQWYALSAVKIREGLVLTMSDITAQKQADEKIRKNYNELIDARENLKKLNTTLEDTIQQRTRELSESEERFRLVSKATNDAIWDLNLVNNDMWFSDTFYKIFGYGEDEVRHGRRFWESNIHPDDRGQVTESLNHAINHGKNIWQAEYRFKGADGSYAHILNRCNILMNEFGVPYRILGSMFNMTEIIAANREARINEQRFLSLSNILPQMVWTIEPGGKPAFFNHYWTDYSGLGNEELKSSWLELIHPEEREHALNEVSKSLKNGTEMELEFRIRNRNGKYRWHLSHGTTQKDFESKVILWVGVTTDIHDQKAISEALKASEHYFRKLADQTPFMVWRIDENADCNYVNKQWEEITGLSMAESLGKGWLKALPAETANTEYAKLQECMKHGLPYQSKFRIARKDGNHRWVMAQSNPIGNDLAEGYIGSMIDITVQELSQQATKLLMHKKDEFMSIASHELKTPITSMKASLQILERLTRSDAGSQVYSFIERSGRQVNKLAGLVDDLLDVTRLQAGKMQFNRSVFTMSELVQNCVDEIQGQAAQHLIRVKGDTDMEVYADKHRIEQVLINFLSNAIKYSPNSDEVILELIRQDNHIKVMVTDKGIGIAEDKINYIFDRFFRVQESSQKFSGLGLGLYISAEIITRHNGKYGVESTEGQGSTFWFMLPLDAQPDDGGQPHEETGALSK